MYAQDSMLSVCDLLDHRLEYDGKTVMVFGRIGQSIEGSYLGGDCGGKLMIDGSEWGYDISLTHVPGETSSAAPTLPLGFQWDRAVLVAAIPKGIDTAQLNDDPDCQRRTGWVAVFGRFETKKTFERGGADDRNIGFGHMGAAPAQLISPDHGKFCLVSPDDEFGPAGIDAAEFLWRRIKATLQRDGLAYFERDMKGRIVPGPLVGVHKLKGTVISSVPVNSATILILGMPETRTPEVTLRLSAPLGKTIAPGTAVEFEGTATEFSQGPFMLTFEVALQNLKIAPKK